MSIFMTWVKEQPAPVTPFFYMLRKSKKEKEKKR